MGQGKKELEEEEEEAPHFLKGGMEAEQQQKVSTRLQRNFCQFILYKENDMYLPKLHVCRDFA